MTWFQGSEAHRWLGNTWSGSKVQKLRDGYNYRQYMEWFQGSETPRWLGNTRSGSKVQKFINGYIGNT